MGWIGRGIATLAAVSALACAGQAAAATVVYHQSGTTDLFAVSQGLPEGPRRYTFQANSSVPIYWSVLAAYTVHWDIFVAPPPKPHGEYLEGNEDWHMEGFQGYGTSVAFDFIVPATKILFYFKAGNEYLDWGVEPGTDLYYEEKYEGPWFEVFAERPDMEPFQYWFTILDTTAAVPEPSTWTLLIVGFGLAGAGLRTHRRVVPMQAEGGQ
jgi:hypothetical protein